MISFKLISEAISWYKARGYTYIDVPWIVDQDAYYSTKDASAPSAKDCTVNLEDGYLVASGEQGFIYDRPYQGNKYVTCTPCFRHEPVHDKWHEPYFMKVELFEYAGSNVLLQESKMVSHAKHFFDYQLLLHCDMESEMHLQPDGTIDLTINGIEVGSYGIRKYKDLHWVFGTGLAEPRFSTVLESL